MRDFISIVYHTVYEVASVPALFLLSLLSRLSRRKYDVGIGPEPLINNIYHKKALCSAGYNVITFVKLIYYITSDFDVRFFSRNRIINAFKYKILYLDYLYLIFKVKSIYIYFQGGVFLYTKHLWDRSYLLKAAGVKLLLCRMGATLNLLTKPQTYYSACPLRIIQTIGSFVASKDRNWSCGRIMHLMSFQDVIGSITCIIGTP